MSEASATRCLRDKRGARCRNMYAKRRILEVKRDSYGPCELDVKGRLQMANTAKTAIVTGASQGIGAGLVEAFLKRGYSVVANSRNITKANPFAAAAKVALLTETSATQARPQRLWIL